MEHEQKRINLEDERLNMFHLLSRLLDPTATDCHTHN